MAAWCGLPPGKVPAKQKEGAMNNTVKVVVLVLVIVVCLGFVIARLAGGKKGAAAGGGGSQERDMYCLECKKAYKATLDDQKFMPLQMGGENANPKDTCPNCGKQAGVAAIKCPNCGNLVPSPGMQAMMMASGGMPGGGKKPVCPVCKKPLAMNPGMGSGGAVPPGGAGPAK